MSKTRVFAAVKRVGVSLGLKASDILLLDMLGAFSPEQDWEAGRRPIVWPSNACLMARTGFSLSALKRHIRRLADAGLLCYADGPNGKRWGRRDVAGHITEAYGLDLAPLRARVEEFEDLEREIRARQALCARLRRGITVARRTIRAHIEAASAEARPGPWERLRVITHRLLARLPSKATSADHLSKLAARWEKLSGLVRRFDDESRKIPSPDGPGGPDMEREGFENGPYIQTTTQLRILECNTPASDDLSRPDNGMPLRKSNSRAGDKIPLRTTIETVLQACPEFLAWIRRLSDATASWDDLRRGAGRLAPMIGISNDDWVSAQERISPRTATAAFALVFDRTCAGHITAPARYLQALVNRAEVGELHLERSFHAKRAGGEAEREDGLGKPNRGDKRMNRAISA